MISTIVYVEVEPEIIPECELMVCILDRAITDIKGIIERTEFTEDINLRTIQKDACLWVLGMAPFDMDYLYSFRSICEFIDFTHADKIKKLAKAVLNHGSYIRLEGLYPTLMFQTSCQQPVQ